MTESYKELRALTPGAKFLFNEPLSNHCTFRIGGNAEALMVPSSEEELIDAVRFCIANSVPYHILGNGSNMLFPDGGLKGLTVKLMGGLTHAEVCGDEIRCEAGSSLKALCVNALENSLTGLEFAYGIPGSVGGAIFMNAGAYGGEISDVLTSVRYYDPANDETGEIKLSEMDYAYRRTPFMTNGRIILSGLFTLKKGNKEEISAKMEELLGKRKASQPLDMPSAGSTFKRPATGYAAALIDSCGLKGRAVGGAEVSRKHAGFVVNKGGATAGDVLTLIEIIKQTVLTEKGIELEPEVVLYGKQ